MKIGIRISSCLVYWLCLTCAASAVEPSADEMAQAKSWFSGAFRESAAKTGLLPFSFQYGDEVSRDFLKIWNIQATEKLLDANRTERTLVWTDSKTRLTVRCVVIKYHNFPTVEWTLHFKNQGDKDTLVLQNIESIDAALLSQSGGDIVLHHQPGSSMSPKEYQPLETVITSEKPFHIATDGGRPTNSNLPYFNLAKGTQGTIVVVGWPGQWAAEFSRDGQGVRVRAGQERTHFKLRPGEEVRSPLTVVQFWHGDRVRSQNIWRRWMIAHNLPRPAGRLPPPLNTPCSSHQFGEMIGANEENQRQFIDRYVEEGLRPDYWWMDAGWYVNNGQWVNTGTWEVDLKRFPHGLRTICDHAHAKGLKTLVWFEPERVTAGSWLYEKHPEWLLAPADLPKPLAHQKEWRLLNLGNPEAWKWLADHVDSLLVAQGIDLYRQDFNMDPLYFWRANDAEDRQGITEIKHVTGYLAYWDELRRRHPGMLIDSCASGGRRNDLETLRRAVPFVRSDYLFEPIGQQGHMYGVSFWIPYNGTGAIDRESIKKSQIFKVEWIPDGETLESDAYLFRSAMSPHLTACYDIRNKNLNYSTLRKLWEQWRKVAPNYYGDYYPLTPYSLEKNAWVAWQFDRPESGEGMVQAFRHSESPNAKAVFKLSGLDPSATYVVTDLDAGTPRRIAGRELIQTGLPVTVRNPSGAVVITYRKAT